MLALYPLDLNQNELRNAVIQVLASAPPSPVKGQTYFDDTSKHTFVYNGTGWEQASGTGGSGTVTSVTFPTTPAWLTASVATNTTTPSISLTATGSLTANEFLATPNGSSGAVSLRAIVAADLPALNGITAPTGDVSLNSHKITNLLDPTNPQDAATKNYVDASIQGVETKPSAYYATTAALAANTYANGASGVGATLTATANGALAAIDGQTPVVNDIVLVKNEATASHNGLYTVTQVGDGTHPYILTRHVDMDVSAEFTGALLAVENGTTNGGSLWLCAVNAPTVGTTSINFTEINKAADLAAGTGITISGNTVSITAAYAGNGIGTVNGIAKGNGSGTISAAGLADIRTAGGAGRYTTTFTGDGSTTSKTISQATHGLAAGINFVQVYDDSTGEQVYPMITCNPSTGSVVITWGTAPANAKVYDILILG